MTEATRYQYQLPARDDDQLHVEIGELGLPGFLGVSGSGAAVEALFEQALGGADKGRLDAAVAAHAPDPNGGRNRARAAAIVAARDNSSPVGVWARATFSVLFAWLNELREAADLPPYTREQILSAVQSALEAGSGDPV